MRSAKKFFSSHHNSNEPKLTAMTPPSCRDTSNTPEYTSIIELKTSPAAAAVTNSEASGGNGNGGGGISYLKMFESFLQDRKKQAATVASLANSSLSLNGSGNFLFGGRRGGRGAARGGGGSRSASGSAVKSCETQTSGGCELTSSRMLASSTGKFTPALINTSGLLSVNINMDDEVLGGAIAAGVLSLPPRICDMPSSSSSSSSSSTSTPSVDSSSSSNCSENNNSNNSARYNPNEIEEPKVVRRQQKYLVELR